MVLALVLASSALEAATIAMLIPLLGLAGVPLGAGATDYISRTIFGALEALAIPPTLAAVLGVFVAMVAIRGAVMLWRDQSQVYSVTRFVAVTRRRLYLAIALSRWEFFAQQRASDLSHALNVEVGRVGVAANTLLRVTTDALVSVAYVVIALWIAPWFTVTALTAGAVLLFLLRRYSTRSLADGHENMVKAGDLAALTAEHLAGMKVAKGYGAEERHVDAFSAADERLLRTYLRMARGFREAEFWRQLVSAVILSLVLATAIAWLRLPPGDIVLLFFLFARFVPRMASLQGQLQLLAGDLNAFTRVAGMTTRFQKQAEPMVGSQPLAFTRAITLRNATYTYPEGDRPAVVDVTLTVPAGCTTALIGPSGAGKSTVVELLMGLLTPRSGSVEVDGVPLDSTYLASWRGQIGYVPQDTFLFHDTVRQNLLWAQPSAKEGELWEALRMASAEDFVRCLPAGLDTVVSDRGIRLSGGERQRLALARALLRRPTLLILDEATSALDTENEQRIFAAVARLHGAMTILIVSHRLSTVRGADLIHVLEDGRVAESGSWSALIANPGKLRALVEAQK
ncbi:MAG: ABC transporter ATP-binding protein [Sphingomicrobium sp.]